MYRKFQADHLFNGTELLPRDKVLLVKNDGKIEAIVSKDDAGEGIENYRGIISPGFINAHCHLELSHMKGLIPEKTGLVDFVCKVVSARHADQNEILKAIEKGEEEMLQNGIVAVGDICNNLSTHPQKQKQRIAYYNFIEVSGWLPQGAESRFDRALNLYTQFNIQDARFKIAIVPHAPYSISEELWKRIIPYFENKAVTIHNQEAKFEDEFFLQGSGDFLRMYELMGIDNSFYKPTRKSSLQSYFFKLEKASSAILVHNTFTTQSDIDFIKLKTKNSKLKTFFCVCANANLYIENTLPQIAMLMKNHCNIILGTDSLASNHGLNLLDEMKTIQKYFPDIQLERMLQWATLNGAQALQMESQLGSFEKGKIPGVILIENTEGVKLNKESLIKRVL